MVGVRLGTPRGTERIPFGEEIKPFITKPDGSGRDAKIEKRIRIVLTN
jgi:hypothetical protein